MTRSLTGDLTLLRRLNHAAVIRLVWENPGISRSEVAARIGITKSAVSLLVQEVIQEGWLFDGDSNGTSTPGRPSIPLRINAERFALIGFELDVTRLNAVSIDPYGTRISSVHQDGDVYNLRETLTRLEDAAQTLQAHAAAQGREVLGVGIGVLGPVDLERELLTFAPNIGWENIPMHRLASEHLPFISPERVFVDNEANLAAMSEYLFGAHKGCGNILYIHLAHGIGGGLIHDHRLYRGRHGFAGEIGHVTIVPNGPKCSCGNRGCAETLFSLNALEREMHKETGEHVNLQGIIARLEQGDPLAEHIVGRAAKHLGVFIGNLVNTLDPEVVIVGGQVAELGEALLEPARLEMQRRLFGKTHRSIAVERVSHGLDAPAMGAAGFAWHRLLQTAESQ
jgi:predicted NBD/HSP70 family sugar kinase